MKDELKGSNEMESMDYTHNQDNDLETIRYYHGTWKNFFNYWKKRGVETDPYKGTELIHPEKKIQKKSTLPYQDFGTYDKSEKNEDLLEKRAYTKHELRLDAIDLLKTLGIRASDSAIFQASEKIKELIKTFDSGIIFESENIPNFQEFVNYKNKEDH